MGRRHIARGRGNLRAARFAISEQKSSGSGKERRRFALPRLLAAAAADSLFVLSLLPPSSDFWGGQWNGGTDGARTRRHVQLSRPAGRFPWEIR